MDYDVPSSRLEETKRTARILEIIQLIALKPSQFRRATLEVVPRIVPVTSGVMERRLPWLVGMKTNLAGTRSASTNDLRERLGPRSFRRQDHGRQRPPRDPFDGRAQPGVTAPAAGTLAPSPRLS